jgi:hypothetical protein
VDRLLFIGFLVGGVVLIFTAGMVVAIYRVPPSGVLRDAMRAGASLVEWSDLRGQRYPADVWFEAGERGKGLVQHEAGAASKGYTLYTTASPATVKLVDMQGQAVHRWKIPFSKAWPDPPHITLPAADHQIYIRRAHVYPDGDLLAGYVCPTSTPYGYGLARFDKDGAVQWKLNAHFHHDFAVAEDGTIHTLTQKRRERPPRRANNLHPRLIEDFIVTLTPDGRVQRRVSVLDAMLNSPYSEALKRMMGQRDAQWDLLHTNTVSLIGADFASHYEAVEPGDVLVCARNLDLLMVIDLDARQVVWGMTGPWHRPHDPEPLANGQILLFDNQMMHGQMAGSRVIAFDPASSAIVWQYRGQRGERFFSKHFGRNQVLANGNVLIADAQAGRIVEVTRSGEVAWSYVTPVRGGAQGELLPIVADAVRYPRKALPFLDEGPRATGVK